jgi:hypothetical protein
MGKYLKSIAKATVLMFAVGALLAMAAPHVAVMAGLAATAAEAVTTLHIADPLWLGLFFGAFGGIHAAATPVIDLAFGDTKKGAATVKTEEKTQVKYELSPDLSQAQAPTVSHCRYVETQREQGSQQQIL